MCSCNVHRYIIGNVYTCVNVCVCVPHQYISTCTYVIIYVSVYSYMHDLLAYSYIETEKLSVCL